MRPCTHCSHLETEAFCRSIRCEHEFGGVDPLGEIAQRVDDGGLFRGFVWVSIHYLDAMSFFNHCDNLPKGFVTIVRDVINLACNDITSCRGYGKVSRSGIVHVCAVEAGAGRRADAKDALRGIGLCKVCQRGKSRSSTARPTKQRRRSGHYTVKDVGVFKHLLRCSSSSFCQ